MREADWYMRKQKFPHGGWWIAPEGVKYINIWWDGWWREVAVNGRTKILIRPGQVVHWDEFGQMEIEDA